MELSEIVERIINGSIDEYSFLRLAKEKRLLEVYEGATIIDYILEYKRNTEEFDKFSVYNLDIAIKYLEYGLKPNVDSEEIFMSKYDEEKTIFERHIENHFDAPFLNIISNLIKDGRSLGEILLCKIDGKYVFEHLEEKGLNTIITYMIVANNKKALELIEKYDVLLYYVCSKEILKTEINGEAILLRLFKTFVKDDEVSKALFSSLTDGCFSINKNSTFIRNHRHPKLYSMSFSWGNISKTMWHKLLVEKELVGLYGVSNYEHLISATIDYLDLFMMNDLKIRGLNSNNRVIVSYAKQGKWDLVAYANKQNLMHSINGKSLLEYLYENFVNNENYPLKSRKKFIEELRKKAAEKDENSIFIAKIAFKYGDFATALKNQSFLLIKDSTSRDTYLDIIIKELLKCDSIETIISISNSSKLLTYSSKYLGNKKIIEYIIEDLGGKVSKRKIHDLLFANVKSEKLENPESIFLFEIFIKKLATAKDIEKILIDFPEEVLLHKSDVESGGDTNLDIIIKRLLESNNIKQICSIKYTSRLLTHKSKYLDGKMIIEYILDNLIDDLSKESLKSQVFDCLEREGFYNNKEAIMLLSIFIKKLATDKDLEKILINFPEKALLHKSDVESGGDTNLDIIIKRLLESNNIKQICSIKYTSRLLTYKSKYLENKMIIEYILDNFKEEFKKTSITSNILLYIFDEGMTLLEFLIKKYRDFVIEWSKDNPLFTNIAIASILKVNGIDMIKFNFSFDEKYSVQYIDSYLKSRFEEKCDKEIPEEASAMIEEFRNLMLKNKKNDRNIIELACASFRRQFANGFEYAYRDLQTMIELGEEERLYLQKGYTSGFSKRYFSNILIDTIVFIRSYYTISDVNHELTHALHFFSNSYEIPSPFQEFPPLTLQQVNKIGSFIASFHRKLDTDEMRFMKALNIDTKDLFLPYYTSFESMVKSRLLEAQQEVDIPPDYLSNKILSESEFKVLFQKETKKEISSRVSGEEYDVEMALENIFDALSKGKFFTKGIDYMGEKFKFKIGHGIEYFKTTHPFIEVIACYGEIIKSPRKEMGLAILRDVMGQEFIDMLDEFYANMYLPDLEYKMEGESYGL